MNFGRKYVVVLDTNEDSSGEETVRNMPEEINTMLRYFSKYYTKEQLIENMEKYNLENMLELVKQYFIKEFKYAGDGIELSNCYKNMLACYINDDERPAFIHVDELFESTIMAFLLGMFKWSKDFKDLEVYGCCFKYILYILNDVCIFGEMQEVNANQFILEVVKDDIQILQLAEDCYWAIIVFMFAHEIAHAYWKSLGKYSMEEQSQEEEFIADKIAYHILLKMIMEKQMFLNEYTYLAPIMFMDFMDLIYYTDKILYNIEFVEGTHPAPVKRKEELFEVVNQDEYDFNTVDGNDLYGGFCDVYDEYKIQVSLKTERGKLDRIIHTERRMKMRGNVENEQKGSNGV